MIKATNHSITNTITSYILPGFCFILFIMSPFPTSAKPLEIGYVEFPPFTYTHENGTPTGILLNKAIKAVEKAGYTWTAESYPGRRLFRNLTRGYTDLFLGIKGIPTLANKTYSGKTSIGSIQMRIYYIGNKKPVYKLEELKNKSVIIVRGYGYSDKKHISWARYIRNRDNSVTFEDASDHLNAFAKLKAQRASYLLAYRLPAQMALKKINIYNLRYNIIHTVKLYFIISRKTKNAKKVLQKIEREYKIIR